MDVVAITETWLHQRIMDTEILDSNYVIFRRDRQQGQRGGGVLHTVTQMESMQSKITSFRPVLTLVFC